jgi:asparagine synthase (glutamine-hydrolysing)
MCGIAGVVGRWSEVRASDIAARMIAAQAHRGPDGQRVQAIAAERQASLVLAHARLSILDLSDAAAQPMRHAETGSWLIYNGEIYNYRELRAELRTRGHQFHSTGDTEVLLHALVAWGKDALPRLNGMYAFAYWDGRGQNLLLGRDPFGMKPLLLAHTPQGVLFASELRGIRASGVVDVRLSSSAIRSFLTYGAVIEPETACAGVVAVPPGRVISITPAGTVLPPVNVYGLDQLLQLDRGPLRGGTPPREPGDTVGAALQQAVARHLSSDARVGVLLSGGIDSSLLAVVANQVLGDSLEFLTVDIDEGQSPEVESASAVSRRLSGRHTVVKLSGRELSHMLPGVLAAMDQPTVDGVNTFVISSVAARAGIRVLLSGLGGDELFGGYTTFQRVPRLARFARRASMVAPLFGALSAKRRSMWRKVALAGRVSETRDAYLLQRAIHSGPSHPAAPALEGPPGDVQMPPETWERLASASAWDAFHQVSYLELVFYMRNQLLRDADIFSSAVAVEMRLPYLDIAVARAAWGLTAADQMAAGRGKAVLRRLLERALPGLDHRRPKVGFTFPWNEWLRGPLKSVVGDVLQSGGAYDDLGLDAGSGRRMFDQFLQARGAASWFHVWSLFVLLDWHAKQQVPLAA